MAYSEKVLDHYENPRNVGSMSKDADNVGTGMVGAPACGDVMKLQIKVGATGIIEDAKFKTYGCGSAIASSSLVTEWVKGKTLDEAMTIRNTQIAEELALPPVKIHCSILAEDAIKAAVADYRKKHGGVGEVEHHGGDKENGADQGSSARNSRPRMVRTRSAPGRYCGCRVVGPDGLRRDRRSPDASVVRAGTSTDLARGPPVGGVVSVGRRRVAQPSG